MGVQINKIEVLHKVFGNEIRHQTPRRNVK